MRRVIDHNQVNSPWCKGGHHVVPGAKNQRIPRMSLNIDLTKGILPAFAEATQGSVPGPLPVAFVEISDVEGCGHVAITASRNSFDSPNATKSASP